MATSRMSIDLQSDRGTESRQRAAARRTAWVLGMIAVAVYAVFLASSGMFAQ